MKFHPVREKEKKKKIVRESVWKFMEIRFERQMTKKGLISKEGNEISVREEARDEVKILFSYEKYRIHGYRGKLLGKVINPRGGQILRKSKRTRLEFRWNTGVILFLCQAEFDFWLGKRVFSDFFFSFFSFFLSTNNIKIVNTRHLRTI